MSKFEFTVAHEVVSLRIEAAKFRDFGAEIPDPLDYIFDDIDYTPFTAIGADSRVVKGI